MALGLGHHGGFQRGECGVVRPLPVIQNGNGLVTSPHCDDDREVGGSLRSRFP